jgi:hypothetical protein
MTEPRDERCVGGMRHLNVARRAADMTSRQISAIRLAPAKELHI